MEANCDVTQFEESSEAKEQVELQAESCRSCDGPDDYRPGMRPGDSRPCGERPCGMRPGSNGRPGGMRPGNGRPGGMRPGNGRPCEDRPCGMRPGNGGRPGGMRPGNGRPCGNRPCGMRPGSTMPDGWRPSDGMRSNSVSDDYDLHSEWNCGNRTIEDSAGRKMVVGCEGQTMSGCHMNDPMDRLGDAFPPVMAFVPWQQWGDLYDPECGLKQGTIFKDLNYIFCGKRC